MPSATDSDVPTETTVLHSNPAARSTDYLLGCRRGVRMGRALGPSEPDHEISDDLRPYYEEEVRLHESELLDRPDSERIPTSRRATSIAS
jgi:hypothetical protein